MRGVKKGEFKPCGDLSVLDLKRHPIWTFDLDRSESDPEADETWVRPEILYRLPKKTDTLFLRAKLTTSTREPLPGALILRFDRYRATILDVALLEPEYHVIGTPGEDLSRILPGGLESLPLSYSADLPIGSKWVSFSGWARKSLGR